MGRCLIRFEQALVTEGAGFVGSHLVNHLVKNGSARALRDSELIRKVVQGVNVVFRLLAIVNVRQSLPLEGHALGRC